MFYWNVKIIQCKYQKQSTRNKINKAKINNKIKFVVGASFSRKKTIYIIPIMNCYPRNGQLRDLDFMSHTLYHPRQYQYSQYPILWVVLNINITVLRARLKRMQSQHSIKEVGLAIDSKTSLVRNSDNIINKMQKLCNENSSLRSKDLLQTQRFIESWSISTTLVP